MTQEFQNSFSEKIEAVYVFPLPQNAALDDMTMQIGNRMVRDEARFTDGFRSFDLRLTKEFRFGGEARLEAGAELFNVFNVTNILGASSANPSGFANAMVRDSSVPGEPGFLRASAFGRPVTTAGGMFGPGGPRAVQAVVKFKF